MSIIKFGVLGVSNHLLKRIIIPLKSTKNCTIHGIASRDSEKGEKFAKDFGIEKYYKCYEDLINDPDIDAVYIPLPNHLHSQWIVKAANSGKNILCEKPIALTASEAQMCFKQANEKNVLLMEAFMYQFHPQWLHVKNIIKTNQIGKIQHINTSFSYNNPDPDNIRNIKEFGGGALMDIGCYAISVPRFLLEKEPVKVVSLFRQHKTFKTDVLTSAILDFEDAIVNFTVSTLSEANQCVEIHGTAGVIKVQIPFNTYVDTKSKITISTPQGTRDIVFDVCDQYGLMFDFFSEAIIHKRKSPISEDQSIGNMRAIDAIFKSAKSKQWEIV